MSEIHNADRMSIGFLQVIIAILLLILLGYGVEVSIKNFKPKDLDNKVQTVETTLPTSPNNNTSSTELNISSYLTTHTFNINGNGKVEFVNNEMIVEGGGATIHGNYSITSPKTARITNYQAVDGLYDASNNRAAAGTLTLNSDGTIRFILSDGNNVRNYTLNPN